MEEEVAPHAARWSDVKCFSSRLFTKDTGQRCQAVVEGGLIEEGTQQQL